MKRRSSTRMPSPITGEPAEGLFPDQGQAVQTTRWSSYAHILALLLLWWAPGMPGGPEPSEVRLPGLVFMVQPGPGGGGGGGGDLSPDPSSVLKIEGEDFERVYTTGIARAETVRQRRRTSTDPTASQ